MVMHRRQGSQKREPPRSGSRRAPRASTWSAPTLAAPLTHPSLGARRSVRRRAGERAWRPAVEPGPGADQVRRKAAMGLGRLGSGQASLPDAPGWSSVNFGVRDDRSPLRCLRPGSEWSEGDPKAVLRHLWVTAAPGAAPTLAGWMSRARARTGGRDRRGAVALRRGSDRLGPRRGRGAGSAARWPPDAPGPAGRHPPGPAGARRRGDRRGGRGDQVRRHLPDARPCFVSGSVCGRRYGDRRRQHTPARFRAAAAGTPASTRSRSPPR